MSTMLKMSTKLTTFTTPIDIVDVDNIDVVYNTNNFDEVDNIDNIYIDNLDVVDVEDIDNVDSNNKFNVVGSNIESAMKLSIAIATGRNLTLKYRKGAIWRVLLVLSMYVAFYGSGNFCSHLNRR